MLLLANTYLHHLELITDVYSVFNLLSDHGKTQNLIYPAVNS